MNVFNVEENKYMPSTTGYDFSSDLIFDLQFLTWVKVLASLPFCGHVQSTFRVSVHSICAEYTKG